MGREFAAGVLEGIDHLISKLETVDITLAQRLLDATYFEVPRPAWDTGELRSSGAAYIGTTKVASTPLTGPNPNVPAEWRKKRGTKWQMDRGGNRSFASMRMRVFNTATRVEGEFPSTVRGKISIVYRARAAALMHEWAGNFTAADAGPHYISAKLARGGRYMANIFREVLA
jgi:hypothetical protein